MPPDACRRACPRNSFFQLLLLEEIDGTLAEPIQGERRQVLQTAVRKSTNQAGLRNSFHPRSARLRGKCADFLKHESLFLTLGLARTANVKFFDFLKSGDGGSEWGSNPPMTGVPAIRRF